MRDATDNSTRLVSRSLRYLQATRPVSSIVLHLCSLCLLPWPSRSKNWVARHLPCSIRTFPNIHRLFRCGGGLLWQSGHTTAQTLATVVCYYSVNFSDCSTCMRLHLWAIQQVGYCIPKTPVTTGFDQKGLRLSPDRNEAMNAF